MALAPLRVAEAADSLRKASTPEPFSSSRSSNWVARGGGLPDYIQHIAHDLVEKRGKSESNAIQMAIGIVKRWARGGGNVDAGTRAAAAKAVAEWEALKAKNKAKGAVQHSAGDPSLADELALREAALSRLVVFEARFGTDGLLTVLAEGACALQEAFDEAAHPRGFHGRFRSLGHALDDLASARRGSAGEDGARSALTNVKIAQHLHAGGDQQGAYQRLKLARSQLGPSTTAAGNSGRSRTAHLQLIGLMRQYESKPGAPRADLPSAKVPGIADVARYHRTKGREGKPAAAIQEAASGSSWSPTLKRTASSSSELERHEVHDGGQHVGTIARRQSYSRNEPDRFSAHAVNGDRITDYSGTSKQQALDAIKKHLEEAPARVAKHSDGKWLVKRPASYSGPDTYASYPTESSARFAAGLPEQPSTPEKSSQVQALGEMLRMDLMTVSGLEIPPLERVQEARRRDPFELAEAFSVDELRDFHGRWRGGGLSRHRLTPASVSPTNTRMGRPKAAAQTRYEGGVRRASARARAVHAAKPQLSLKELPGAIGKGVWDAAARRAVAAVKRGTTPEHFLDGTAADTEHAHRAKLPNGGLGPYSEERLQLHEAIINALLQGKQSHEGSAQAHFTAGGPASGKSGLEKFGMVNLPSDVVHANPDIVREMMPEYRALMAAGRADIASAMTHEEASHIAKRVTRIALGRQHHVLVDTVGNSGAGKFANKIQGAIDAGHQTHVHYATTDVATAIKRAAKRERQVPDAVIRGGHQSVSERFAQEIQHIRGIHHLQIVDTTQRPNTVIAERRAGSDKLVIKDAAAFRRFLAKAGG